MQGQYNLGDLYYKGHGIEKDWIRAYAWWTLSGAAEINPAAREKLSYLSVQLTPHQLSQATELLSDLRTGILRAQTNAQNS